MFSVQAKALENLAFALVPGLEAYIAGGFAADYTAAGDLDLWILNDPTLERTAAKLTELGVRFSPATRGESVPVEEITRSVLRISTPLLPIHVIGTAEPTIRELLNTFDISTHRWALSRAGTLIAGEGATKPWETGKVLTYKFPTSTDARVKKLEARYGITIDKFVPPATTPAKKRNAA